VLVSPDSRAIRRPFVNFPRSVAPKPVSRGFLSGLVEQVLNG
jgi:hypothetical protein